MSVTIPRATADAATCDPACEPSLAAEPLTPGDATQLATTLKALADPARLRLLSMVAAHDGGEACVCDLTGPIGLSQPTVSHHLKKLVDAGLLSREQRGIWAYYALRPAALAATLESLYSTVVPSREQ